MTDSPVRAVLTGAAVMIAAAGAAVFPALAQGTGPVSLSTPKQLKPAARDLRSPGGASGKALTRGGYQARPVGRSLSGIQVNRLGTVDPAAAGILDGSQGAFDTNLWQGSRLPFVKRLLAERPERVRSHVMRRLLRRVQLLLDQMIDRLGRHHPLVPQLQQPTLPMRAQNPDRH